LEGYTAAYVGVVRRALARPGLVLVAAIAVLVGSYTLYSVLGRGVEFFPQVEPSQAMLNIHARGDLSVLERDLLVREVEARILDMPEFETVYARSGVGFGGETEEDIVGRIQLRYVDGTERRPSEEILRDVRRRTADLAGVMIEPEEQESGITSGKPIQLELRSREPERLPAAVARIRQGMDEIGGLVDVTDSRPIPGIDWRLEVDRELAAR